MLDAAFTMSSSLFDPSELGPNFLWGASTCAYQIEGAATEDGRSPSIWDTFCRQPGKIERGETGDVACDHYHRYKEDVLLMKRLGLDAYRFSISWPRVLPTGKGQANLPGIDFYQRLVDELLAHEIAPWVCFYHWDLPQALQDRGGWTNRDTASWYTDYVLLMAEKLGDRVKHFVMLNEPMVVAFLGHYLGIHAPGTKSKEAFLATTHHLNLALGSGLTALRAQGGDWQLGTVTNLGLGISNDPADAEAVQRHDELLFWPFLDPVLLGRYPEALVPFIEPFVQSGDLTLLQHPLDFLGINYYFPERVRRDPSSPLGFVDGQIPKGVERTEMGWEVRPQSFTDILLAVRARFPKLPPIYITENGAAFADPVAPDGSVDDPRRVAFLERHIAAMITAKRKGIPIEGYFVWSILDNFEWAYGYRPRFGLVHVDFATQKRTPKTSYERFGSWIRSARAS